MPYLSVAELSPYLLRSADVSQISVALKLLSIHAIFIDQLNCEQDVKFFTGGDFFTSFRVLARPHVTPNEKIDAQAERISDSQGDHHWILSSQPGASHMMRSTGLAELLDWLSLKQPIALCIPLPILPLMQSIVNIYPLDPFLAAHYQRQCLPLLSRMTDSHLAALWHSKQTGEMTQDAELQAWIQDYNKLERKLYRQYQDH